GDRRREIQVILEPERLASLRLSLLGAFGALQQENFNIPAGRLHSGERELTLRAMGKFRTLEELSRLEIPTPAGAHVQLREIGEVKDSYQDPETSALFNGKPAVMFGVIKQSSANSVTVGDAVRQKLQKLQTLLPAGVSIRESRDSTVFTKESNQSVWEHMIVGGLLAVAVLYLFLRSFAATFIGGLAIPISIVSTFFLMQMAGFSFNLLTNLALSMVVGILVDDAVVDLENIYRHMERGTESIKAAIAATFEIQLAVTATTLAIVAVFLPVAFMTGMVGKFFKEFGITVTFAVLMSLLVARTVTPMLAARMLKVRKRATGASEDTGFFLAPAYRQLLAWALGHRKSIVALATLAFLGGIALIPFIPKGFMTQADRKEFSLQVKLPKGSSVATTERAAQQVEQLLLRRPEVKQVFTIVGSRNTSDQAQLYVQLVDRHDRQLTDQEVAQLIRDEAQHIPGLQTKNQVIGMVAQGDFNYPVYIQLRHDDLAKLQLYADTLIAALKQHPQFTDVDSTLAQIRPELRLQLDRSRAAELGVTPAAIAQTLRLATMGDTTTTFNEGEYDYDIRVRANPAIKNDPEWLKALTIPVPGRPPVAIGAVADLQYAPGIAEISRQDRSRMAAVVANLRPGTPLGSALQVARQAVADLKLPPEVMVEFAGQAEDMRETFTALGQALALAIVFIYLILAIQFESFIHPFTIMLSLPLSLVGAFLALWLSRTELGMIAMIGIIMLMGIVTKNAILIVDFAISLRQQGMSRLDALLHAGPIRLRPILMTTAAMTMGMLPMAFRIGAGSEFRYPMAIVVIGGLLTSTLLTLLVVPVFYTLLDDLSAWLRRWTGWRESARAMTDPYSEA
ncbi:MAG: efflux RND transporter permease subunit, partial [Cyanobacteria bacterium NC_groundwater_1444_Ag_S-0.65um_54_12]|nr:efflux RND transporter permease subunit [Cyanobacteria bacterium NC_groundwater_1444_Ag_S-0.65um_54_12]